MTRLILLTVNGTSRAQPIGTVCKRFLNKYFLNFFGILHTHTSNRTVLSTAF